MNTTEKRRVCDGMCGRLIRIARAACLAGILAVPGCSYLETVMNRTPQHPDDRIRIGRGDGMLLIYPNDVSRYVCEARLVLQCERAGAVSYSCQCADR